MKTNIHYHQYTLRSAAALNAKSTRTEHSGALIRVGADGQFGYGCLHPWPELGDAPLPKLLESLRDGGANPLVRSALDCAEIDHAARADGVSLFDELKVPRSHATLPQDVNLLENAVKAGFDVVKMKAGRDVVAEYQFFSNQQKRFSQLKWRIDFNGSDALEFIQQSTEAERKTIDFIEDPSPENDAWQKLTEQYQLNIAVDRNVQQTAAPASVMVIKPALNVISPLLETASNEGHRAVVTSYMDHPLGQTYAAYCAAVALRNFPGIIDTCGLITHTLFEADAFTEALGPPAPEFYPAEGTGLGFNELLEKLPWKPLS